MQPYVGQIVRYVMRPGQIHAGQSELAAIITRVRTSHSVPSERPQEFKRLVKERKPDAEGVMTEITREVTELRMVPATEMAPPSVDLRIFVPDRDDMLRYERVMAQSETVKGHCWRPLDVASGDTAELVVRVTMLQANVAELSAQVVELANMVTEVVELANMVTEPVAETKKRAAAAR